MKILLVHGPNLDMLGTREISIYGDKTLPEINADLQAYAKNNNAEIIDYQSNNEQHLIERMHLARTENFDYMIINPAGFTHTSIALRDAVIISEIPFIEVHLSNPHARESFRKNSYFSDIAQAVIMGLGYQGYKAALEHILHV